MQVPIVTCLLAAGGYLGFAAADHPQERVVQAEQRDPYALSLTVTAHADTLQVAWDRNAPPVLASQWGALSFMEGERTNTLELTREQLRSGSVIYRRATGQVRLRLDVFLNATLSVSESWEAVWPPAEASP